VLEACSGDCLFLFGANTLFFSARVAAYCFCAITRLTIFYLCFFNNSGVTTMASLSKINPNSAGIDIGASKIFIAVEDCEVKSFNTFTDDYLKAIAYLKEHNINSVAMEATGIYWIPLFEMLEASDIEVCLVNAREVKNVPGRKSDVQDCQWIQQLYSFGLLRPCFIPDDAIRQLRTYVRLRNDHISLASKHIQHMQKALDLMNIKLHKIASSGMKQGRSRPKE